MGSGDMFPLDLQVLPVLMSSCGRSERAKSKKKVADIGHCFIRCYQHGVSWGD